MAKFKTSSRYFNGTVSKNREGKSFLVLRQPLNLSTNDPEDLAVLVTSELVNRPDLVSQKAYGSPDYWWVIYEYNKINDPFFQLKINSVIKIPKIDRVLAAIESLSTT